MKLKMIRRRRTRKHKQLANKTGRDMHANLYLIMTILTKDNFIFFL